MPTATSFKKGDVIRTIRPCTGYMDGRGDRVVGFADVEVRVYTVEAVYPGRNKLKVVPHASSPGIAYRCLIPLGTFPGKVEKLD